MQNLGPKLAAKIEFWAFIISSIDNLKLSVKKLSEFCSVCRKIATSALPIVLIHDAIDECSNPIGWLLLSDSNDYRVVVSQLLSEYSFSELLCMCLLNTKKYKKYKF